MFLMKTINSQIQETQQKRNENYTSSYIINCLELPLWLSGKEFTCQFRRHRFDPWAGKIPGAVEQVSPCTTTTTKPELQSLETATTEPACCSYRGPSVPEPCHLKRGHHNEKLVHSVRSSSCSPLLEKSLCSNKDPAQPNIKK